MSNCRHFGIFFSRNKEQTFINIQSKDFISNLATFCLHQYSYVQKFSKFATQGLWTGQKSIEFPQFLIPFSLTASCTVKFFFRFFCQIYLLISIPTVIILIWIPFFCARNDCTLCLLSFSSSLQSISHRASNYISKFWMQSAHFYTLKPWFHSLTSLWADFSLSLKNS